MIAPRAQSITDQRGLVLVTSLLLLVVVTILAIGMFRSFGLDERIAGNVREKQRALNAAETAEQYAEYWLSSGNATPAVNCGTTGWVSSNVGQVCNSTLQAQAIDPAVIPWTQGVNYVPSNQPLPTGVGAYYKVPAFQIGFLNTATVNGTTTTIYQIDAVGYGGSANTAAVVESTYRVRSGTKNLGEGQ
jgi:type IV pilus assembly protein PilX